MGWFPIWGQSDPLKEIDPSLRRFLEKETPKKYGDAEQQQRPTTPASSTGWDLPTFRSIFGLGEGAQQNSNGPGAVRDPQAETPAEPTLPQESLFQDGRYAHLWKGYRSPAEAEDAGKSDQEKLTDIVSAYKERNAELSRAAMENCAMEQMAIHECFATGSWASRMTMCRAENRALDKCVNMQTRFLRALGYLSLFDRSPEENEKIQMHADKLYQRMLKQEKTIDEAKEKGLPLPAAEPLITASDATKAAQNGVENTALASAIAQSDEYKPKRSPIQFETLPKNLQEKYTSERFKDLEGLQLELAKRQLEQDLAWQAELLDRFGDRYVEERKERLERQARGQERLTDKVKRWLDMRDWRQIEAFEADKKDEQAKKRVAG